MGCRPDEIFFTSGGTEGDNWANFHRRRPGHRRGKHIVTTAVEHAAVLEPLKALQDQGYEITFLKPDKDGRIRTDGLVKALRPDTVLVSMMLVNNETGAAFPVAEAARALGPPGRPPVPYRRRAGFFENPLLPRGTGC